MPDLAESRIGSWGGVLASLLLLTLQVYSQPPGVAAKKEDGANGFITGRIIRDDGEPVVGQNVMIIHSSIEDSQRQKQRFLTVATDDDGVFKSPELEYATYRVQVNVPGYVNASLGNNLSKLTGGATYLPGDIVNISLTPGGVITGKVTSTTGKPIVAANVNVVRVKDGDGIAVLPDEAFNSARTDDRGIYRVFGLPAGNYLVSSNGVGFALGMVREVVEYYPAGPVTTAQEVSVTLGNVTSGIDIRHGGKIGHVVTGSVTGAKSGSSVVAVRVFSADSGQMVAMSIARSETQRYLITGLSDGDYFAIAYQSPDKPYGDIFVADSAPRKFSIKGNDPSGIDLRLRLTSGISGNVTIAPGEVSCTTGKKIRPDSIVLSLIPENATDILLTRFYRDLTSDPKGNFSLSGLPSGRMRFDIELPGDNWYVKSLTMPMLGTVKPARVSAGGWIPLTSGAKVADISLTVAEGAAQLYGNAAVAENGRAFLIPVDKELAGDISRHYEVIGRAGKFSFKNVAPGKYWILWKGGEVAASASPEAFDAESRAALRKSAEAAGKLVELAPCQKVDGVKFLK